MGADGDNGGGRGCPGLSRSGFGFVAVVVVRVAVGRHAGFGDGVEYDAGEGGPGLAQGLDRAQDGGARSHPGTDDEADSLDVMNEEQGVADAKNRRAVHDDPIILLESGREQIGEAALGQKFGGVGERVAGGTEGEVFDFGGADVAGFTGQEVSDAGNGMFVAEDLFGEGWAEKIAVNQKGAEALAGEAGGEVEGAEGFAFARHGAGEKEAVALVVGIGDGEGCAEVAEGLGTGGRGFVADDEAGAFGFAVFDLGDGAEDGQLEDLFSFGEGFE
ncbi:MAG: hypothetical protein PCFJNLEI_02245 [Verrucomicrobiae bacterium]|nr:hypothetical protein [Verrucomicrobiae bacterium]